MRVNGDRPPGGIQGEAYDVVIAQGCQAEPELADIEMRIPALSDGALHRRLMEWWHAWPDFLGLDVTKELAATLVGRLRRAGASARVASSAYRQPRISREQARAIAETAIACKREQHAKYEFNPVEFRGEDPETWDFWAVSEQWRAEGHIPGALSVSVDKLDGHVWQPGEWERYLNEK